MAANKLERGMADTKRMGNGKMRQPLLASIFPYQPTGESRLELSAQTIALAGDGEMDSG